MLGGTRTLMSRFAKKRTICCLHKVRRATLLPPPLAWFMWQALKALLSVARSAPSMVHSESTRML